MRIEFSNPTTSHVTFEYSKYQNGPEDTTSVPAGGTAFGSEQAIGDFGNLMVVGVIASTDTQFFIYHTYLSCPGVDLGAPVSYPPSYGHSETVSFDRLTCDPQTRTATVGVSVTGPDPDTVGVTRQAWGNRTTMVDGQPLPFHAQYHIAYSDEWEVIEPFVDTGTGSESLAGHSYILPRSCPPAGDALTIAAPTSIALGHTASVATRLTDAIHHDAISGVIVRLWARVAGSSTFTFVARRTTSASGGASVAVSPRRDTTYQWRFAGNASYLACKSPKRTVTVT